GAGRADGGLVPGAAGRGGDDLRGESAHGEAALVAQGLAVRRRGVAGRGGGSLPPGGGGASGRWPPSGLCAASRLAACLAAAVCRPTAPGNPRRRRSAAWRWPATVPARRA